MKILFSADIHIKLGQKNVPIEWAKNRYRLLFEQYKLAQPLVDINILGGDIFDRLPNMEELELYFELLASFSKYTLIYSGNHEALKKNTTFLTHLKNVTRKINSKAEIIDDYFSFQNIDIIPYNKLKEYHPADIDFHGNILCTHVRGNIPPHVKAEVPLEIFDRWDVVLAGDLHSYSNSQLNILYPGSPVTTSFHRTNVETGYIILDSDTLKHEWKQLELPQLIRKTISPKELQLPGDYDHIVYEIEGNVAELMEVTETSITDRKVVKKNYNDAELILHPGMNILEELEEYFRYILMLPEDTVVDLLEELYNYVKK